MFYLRLFVCLLVLVSVACSSRIDADEAGQRMMESLQTVRPGTVANESEQPSEMERYHQSRASAKLTEQMANGAGMRRLRNTMQGINPGDAGTEAYTMQADGSTTGGGSSNVLQQMAVDVAGDLMGYFGQILPAVLSIVAVVLGVGLLISMFRFLVKKL